jgi:hypothetical protein
VREDAAGGRTRRAGEAAKIAAAGDEVDEDGEMSYLPEPGSVDSAKISGMIQRTRRAVAPIYRVGEPLVRQRRNWPAGAEFAFGPGGHELTLFRRGIGPELIDDLCRGPAEFALIVEQPIIVLAYRFGDAIAWEDAPYSWHLQPEFRRVVPAAVVAPEARALIWITLVGADDGIIHAQRGMTLSPPFTRALHEAIRTQAMKPFNPCDCTAAISNLYLTHPDRLDRLGIAVARTMGNA